MDDADFQSLRLGFGRSEKRAKSEFRKKPKCDLADINGYVGPWGKTLIDTSKTPSGPSEVR